jgi:hypothetical protein
MPLPRLNRRSNNHETALRLTLKFALRIARAIGHEDVTACLDMTIIDISYWLEEIE